jgi:hypothetical protein
VSGGQGKEEKRRWERGEEILLRAGQDRREEGEKGSRPRKSRQMARKQAGAAPRRRKMAMPS